MRAVGHEGQDAGVRALMQHDMSIVGLFMQADLVVKTVMVGLALMSLWSWAVAIDKWLQFRDLNATGAEFEQLFWSGRPLEEVARAAQARGKDPFGRVFLAGVQEWSDSARAGVGDAGGVQAAQDRCDRMMRAAITRELSHAGKGLSVLASIGSSAPFIGLFGTVWGIMNSFTAIAGQQQTSLTVVAPGIAEALFATALGLVAAVPAVIFYNKFAGDLDRFGDRLEAFSDQAVAQLSRRLGERY
jgi:biopolymer transport protein TolQ